MRSVVMFVTLTWAALANATVMVPLDTHALTGRANQIVLGKVEKSTSRWTNDRQAIYTEVTVRVSRTYKGGAQPGDAIVLRREGGTVDGIGMHVFGAATFTVGEEVVLFLENRGGATYTVGMTQGKLRVTTAPDGSKHVAADLSNVAFTKPIGPRTTTAAPRPLEEFEREIRGHVQRAKP